MTKLSLYFQEMKKRGASDLFLAEFHPVSLRIQGNLVFLSPEEKPTKDDFRQFFQESLPAGTLARLEEERDLDLSLPSSDGECRYRLNLSLQQGGIAIVARLIPQAESLDASVLQIPARALQLMKERSGLVLVTGATGSGKSTTLACLLNELNHTQARHVVTLEDPIEFVYRDDKALISQREVGTDTRNFASALRHVVRQNPDVIFIGEMRDGETVTTALNAAMTGHLVAATMHTMNVRQTFERIYSFWPEEQREQAAIDLSLALRAIISQRLVPRADGKGRIAAFEILVSTERVRRMMLRRDFAGLDELMSNGIADGMCTMNQALLSLVQKGTITEETALAFSDSREELSLMLQGLQTGSEAFKNYSGDLEQGLSIKQLLKNAVQCRASDMILTVGAPPTVRIDGELQSFEMPTLTAADTRKLLYSVLSPQRRADFEEKKELDFALEIRGLSSQEGRCRFRVNGFFQKGAVAAVFRLIPSSIPAVEKLGLPPAVLKLTNLRQGLVLVVGPTGSGKSTTLTALISMINQKRPCHIITVEDPIEFIHPHGAAIVEQREIHEDTHSFADALKYLLRQNPDVILVGEMRDAETIAAALTAAETGHLVFATLHTNDATQTVDRIVDIFTGERQKQVRAQLASALECVISQRLLPRIDQPGGRIAAFEILMGTSAVHAMIRDQKTHLLKGQMEASAKDGMITMERALRNLYEARKISAETLLSLDPHAFEQEL